MPDEVLSNPASDQAGQSPNAALVATSPPVVSVTARSKEHKRSRHRVGKISKEKKGQSSPASPSTNRSSREPSTMLEEQGANMNLNQSSYAYQNQIYPGGGLMLEPQQPAFAQYPYPPYQTMPSSMQGPQTFGPYQTGQILSNQNSYQMAYSPQLQAGYSVGYSSPIEDVVRPSNGQQDDTDLNQPYITSQYITARQDSGWRATR
jgi:hypothetical protein